MRGERPDALALLRQAQRSLQEDVIPGLTGAARYQALMTANALGIAVRELEAGSGAREEYASALGELMDAPEGGDDALGRRLVGQIRAGDWDGDARLFAILERHTDSRLAVVNPRARGGGT